MQGEEGGALTHFEVVTALAYKHFEEQEVGSGPVALWVLACGCRP